MTNPAPPYVLKTTDTAACKTLAETFEGITLDAYCDGKFRYRALNRYELEKTSLKPLPLAPLYQSRVVNKLWGGMDRTFPISSFTDTQHRCLEKIAVDFVKECNDTTTPVEFGVHSIRTVSRVQEIGHPAPEGIHSDGYLFTSILCLRRDSGLEGGVTQLFSDRAGSNCVFEQVLQPGDFLIIDDKRLFHYTSPVPLKKGGVVEGIRDVMVFTLSPKDCDPKEIGAYSR